MGLSRNVLLGLTIVACIVSCQSKPTPTEHSPSLATGPNTEGALDFLTKLKPEQRLASTHREVLIFANGNAGALESAITKHLDRSVWGDPIHTSNGGGDSYRWRNERDHSMVEITTGTLAIANAALVTHQRIGESDVMVDWRK